MHHAFAMRVCECPRHVTKDAERLGHRHRLPGVNARPQRLAAHIRHDVIRRARRVAGRQHRHNVGLLQARRKLHLAREPVDAYAFEQFRSHDFDDHLTPQRELGGHEHLRHPASAQLALKAVSVSEGVEHSGCFHWHNNAR